MKKTLIASLMGIATCGFVTTGYSQGNVNFQNYNFSAGQFAQVYLGSVAAGNELYNAFSAQLWYSSSGTAGTFTAVGSPTVFYGSSLGDSANGGGFFNGGTVTVSQSLYNAPTSGAALPAYFMVEAYNTQTVGAYAAGQLDTFSGVIAFSTLATAYNLHLAGDLLSDNADVTTPMTSFAVTPVPEPATLALAGLGGFGMLMALRRKKA